MTYGDLYIQAKSRADRIRTMRMQRIRKLLPEAGLSATLPGIHPHNAMVAYRKGKPWPGVDYAKVRLILRLMDAQWEPYRILERWTERMTQQHGATFMNRCKP